GNNITNNRHGIDLSGSSNNTVSGNNITANSVGIDLHDSSDNNTVSGNNITNNRHGIWLRWSSDNTVSGNNITNNDIGIYLYWSSNKNLVSGNNITHNNRGIDLSGSYSNTVSGNNVTNNNDYGMRLYDSGNNTLRNNDVSNNKYNFGVYGWSLSEYIQDIDDSNTVNGKPIHYLINRRDMTVPFDVGWIALINCTRMTVKNLNLANNGQGVLLAFTANSTIAKNNITNNDYGIWLRWSSNNTVSGNNITNNEHGVCFNEFSNSNTVSGNNVTNNGCGAYFYYSFHNIFYHNNFISNTEQVYDYFCEYPPFSSISTWDKGYPSCGNYWSDYTGVDVYSGPYQNLTGYDGVGDTPYVIDENNQDNFPLMYPYTNYTQPWDITGPGMWVPDGKCDIRDIALVALYYGSVEGDGRYDVRADITGPTYLDPDGKVDIRDIALIAIHYGELYP
ncbi:right-handed parallel beta-helix repeat-containing protein, partial [Candidatus Bathyarchaeota archaeon]|nr:right-handed parallel beta-helix repeat-containing protein [Candidatus Bathyarchaeota archaeon]